MRNLSHLMNVPNIGLLDFMQRYHLGISVGCFIDLQVGFQMPLFSVVLENFNVIHVNGKPTTLG